MLWLSIKMVDYANYGRPNPGGVKVGGHQSSSSSFVTVMTYLYFEFMRAGDAISVKPHASPVYHAIQYLLGNLEPQYLTTLRGFHGLQAYPSRTKDPDGVDFSTGSVGLGAVAPNYASLVNEYLHDHFETPDDGRRFISLVGDAELDEGSVWETIAEPALADMKNVLWVVDLNRQSLDRIIPGIRVRSWKEMFAANGWRVVDAKYGKRLQAAFEEPNGDLLRTSIDEMSNDLYQRLLRIEPAVLRDWLPRTSRYPNDMMRLLDLWDDAELQDLFRNLGGHDFAVLREAFEEIDLEAGPNVLFAYTLKGWRLPSVGDPQNHSVNLTREQMEELGRTLGIPEGDGFGKLDPESDGGPLLHGDGREPGQGSARDGRQRGGAYPHRVRAGLPGRDVDAADIRVGADGHLQKRAGSVGAARDGKPRRCQFYQPGRMDKQGGGVEPAREGAGARGADPARAAVGRVGERPAHRAGHL